MGTQRFGDDDAKDHSTGGVSLVHVSSGVEEWLVTVPGWASPVAFSPDGKTVAVLCGGQSIRFLETATGTVKHEIRPADTGQGVRWDAFAMPPQGHMLAIGGVNKERKGSVEVWSTQDQAPKNPPAAAAELPNIDYEVYAQYKGQKSDTKAVSQFDDRKIVNIVLRIDTK